MTKLMLDLGGVVIRTPFEMLAHVGDPPWRGPFDPERDHLWLALQRSEITERDYWRTRARELHQGEDSLREFFRQVLDHPEEIVVCPEIAQFLAEVESPAALTNDMSAFHSEEWVERMTLLRRFDPLIDLSAEPYLKPDPRAFDYALSELGLSADEVLFVDDQPFNLRGAEAVGMRTEWFDVTDVDGSIVRTKKAMDDG